LLAGVGCATALRDKGMEQSTATYEALREVRSARRHAVLVGVDTYEDPSFTRLKHARDDARVLSELFGAPETGGFHEVHLIEDATRGQFFEALRTVRDLLRPEDVLVVYFSGHGTRVLDGDHWRRFLVPSDGQSSDLEGTAIDLVELQGFFSTLPPARKSLVVDACFNGDGKSSARPADRDVPVEPLSPPATAMGPGEAHLFATSAGRPSREDDRLGHGVYTYFLIDAMSWSLDRADANGDRALTAWEAHDYARGRTLLHTNGLQVPEAAFRIVGEADLILAGDAEKRGNDRSLVYLYPASDEALDGAALVVDGRNKGSFPGSVPLSSGRHHFVLTDADGTVALDGHLTLAPGRAYSMEEIQRLATGPGAAVGWRMVGVASPPMDAIVGAGAIGPEVWYTARTRRGPGAGQYVDVSLGAAVSPSRFTDGGTTRVARPLAWATGSTGYQDDWFQLRYRLGWGVSLNWIPPNYFEEKRPGEIPYEHVSQAGWVFGASGPHVSSGWVMGRGWAATATVRAHAAGLDPDGMGIRFVPWVNIALGVETVR